jgi:hypothetical protein
VPAPGQPRNGPRGSGSQDEDRRHTEQHEQQISHAELATVLALGAREIAHGREVDARPDAAPHEMEE